MTARLSKAEAASLGLAKRRTLSVDLPMPPSVWDLYVGNGHNRRRSAEYRKWVTEAGWMLVAQRNQGGCFKQFKGDVDVKVRAYRPANRGRDLDNILKALLDLLKSTGTIVDDRHVIGIDARWMDEGTPCNIEISEAT